MGEYRAFVSATGGSAGGRCLAFGDGDSWENPGSSQTDRHPVTCVSLDDAQAYVLWLSRTARAKYRLPTEVELDLAAEDHSYANRTGRGTHRAVRRYERFRDRYVLRGDVYRCFRAIDHAILKADLRRRIGCRRTLAVLNRIIDGSNPQKPDHHGPAGRARVRPGPLMMSRGRRSCAAAPRPAPVLARRRATGAGCRFRGRTGVVDGRDDGPRRAR